MSDNINKMDFKQLRNEVQLLRDELAIMKRKYEDILYNLDTDNFSSRFVKEQGDMRTAIEITAEGIKTKVSNEDFESALTQTADQFTLQVNALDELLSSKITQTATKIETRVSDLENFKTSTFKQTAYGFTLDGEQTTFTGVIYLTDNNNNRKFSIFHDESQGYETILMHNTSENPLPIVIGDYDSNVYIGNYADGYQVATRDWVLENGGGSGGVAVFG